MTGAAPGPARPGRADLLALTDAGLAQLSNAGLVKRGLRDLAAGTGPALAELPDGTVEARYADGIVTRLPPGRAPADASCTCPASGICRHRVTLVLAYQQEAAARAPAAEPEEGLAGHPADWDPGTLDIDAFEAALPAGARQEIRRLLAAGVAVRLDRGPVPAARLPMATVRFLVPHDAAYARCDCAAAAGCAHAAVAMRAFRAAAGAAEVVLGEPPVGAAPPGADGLAAAVDDVLRRLLRYGVVAGLAAHGQGLDRAARLAEAAGATQLLLAIQDLAAQVAAYDARSAAYDEAEVLLLAAELFARTRATDAAAALGLGEPMEAAMSKARLMSLGVRVVAQGPDLAASVLLADTDTGSAMLLRRVFAQAGDAARGKGTAGRMFAPGLPVAGLGRGQVVTSVARRRADGMLLLGSGAGGRTMLMGRPAVQSFPTPLQAGSLPALLDSFARRPPAFLRPRNWVEDVHVFDVEAVLGQSWAPGAQVWQAAVTLPGGGGTVFLEREHNAGAPGALDVLSAAAAGRHGPVRQVAGTVRVQDGALVCTPWSLSANRLIVPDLDETDGPAVAVAAVRRSDAASPLNRATAVLAGTLHAGRGGVESVARGRDVATALHASGYATAALRMLDWLGTQGDDGTTHFGRAAVWMTALAAG